MSQKLFQQRKENTLSCCTLHPGWEMLNERGTVLCTKLPAVRVLDSAHREQLINGLIDQSVFCRFLHKVPTQACSRPAVPVCWMASATNWAPGRQKKKKKMKMMRNPG